MLNFRGFSISLFHQFNHQLRIADIIFPVLDFFRPYLRLLCPAGIEDRSKNTHQRRQGGNNLYHIHSLTKIQLRFILPALPETLQRLPVRVDPFQKLIPNTPVRRIRKHLFPERRFLKISTTYIKHKRHQRVKLTLRKPGLQIPHFLHRPFRRPQIFPQTHFCLLPGNFRPLVYSPRTPVANRPDAGRAFISP